MYLYLCRSEDRRAAFREELVRKALKDYCERRMIKVSEEGLKKAIIEKGPKGKPFFTGFPPEDGVRRPEIHHSVSHSGDWWGCLMADEPVGFDMEVCREKVDCEKVAKRFFTAAEYEWILSSGRSAFFEIWVRKEAYVKYLGTGLSEGLNSFSVVERGELVSEVVSTKGESVRQPCFVRSYGMEKGVKAAYCCESGKEIAETIFLEAALADGLQLFDR